MSDTLSTAAASMFQWIMDNREAQNIQLVIHTGDVVENGLNPKYWERIEPTLTRMAAETPFLAAAGNHDIGRDENDYSQFLRREYLAGSDPTRRYAEGKGSWISFHAGGRDFIAVSLGYGCYDEEGLGWMRQVFSEHPDSIGIVAVHEYMGYKGRMSPNGMLLQEGVVAQCPNVRLVLCGHVRSTGRRQDSFDDNGDGLPERTVHAMVYNYQQVRAFRDSGYLRILTFDPMAGSISVTTYSPCHDDYICMGTSSDRQEFVLYDAF